MSKRGIASHSHGSSSMPAVRGSGGGGDESAFSRFMREQVWAADKVAGNVNILIGVGFFAASIVGIRVWGHMLLVPSAS